MALNLNAIGKRIGPITHRYDWRDFVLYALGVGAGFEDLEYVYEDRLKVLPSASITTIYHFFTDFMVRSGVNLAGILHGEHELILHSPIPPAGGEFTSEGRITAMHDKGPGKGALVIGEIDTCHPDGQRLFTNVVTLFSRLDGGFGGSPGPQVEFSLPDRPPDFEEDAHPSANQPLLYRLSGDTFALHVNPDFAQASGFTGPIMHGLCTHGYACRAVIKHLFPGEPERLVRFSNRFTRALYPGTPIKTQIWQTGDGEAVFRTLNADNGDVVIDRGLVQWISREEASRRAAVRGIRFDGQVAIITGAGGGLGRTYALELARRGAHVVVNDLGGQRDGSGHSASPADAVVDEIRHAGGSAVASYDSVASPDGAHRIVQAALDHFGRLDILINNAGILRDKSFAKLEPDMWHAVLDVHLHGAFYVTQPAFQAMREQGYGRIVFTTSAAGLFGNFGQANYAAAKMGLVGLMNTLKLEGAKYNITLNTVAPLAITRLTEDVLPPDLAAKLQPEYVTPLVLFLCSSECTDSGLILNAGAGFFSRAAVVSGPGTMLGREGKLPTLADVYRGWQEVDELSGAEEYDNANAALMAMFSGPKKPPPKPEPKAEPDAPPAQNVAAIFAAMDHHFQPAAAAGVDVVFQFHITGPGGGDWQVAVKDGQCTVSEGVHPSPTTTLTMSNADFIDYVGGRLPAMQAYTTGRLKIGGDLMKSQLIEKLFQF